MQHTPTTEQSTPPRATRKELLPLLVFFLLSAASAWTVWLWPIDNRERVLTFVFVLEFKVSFFWLKLAIGNCLPGILAVIWVLSEGKDQFRHMLSTLTRWRTPLRWYIVAFAFPWVVLLPALVAVLLYFPKTEYSLPPAVEFFERFLVTLPVAGLWEELAWRAFALRKLESRYSRPASALLVGLYWGVWHIPLWLVEFDSIPALFFVGGIVNVVALSLIFAYLYHRSSESLPVVILLHTTYDVVATQVSLIAPHLDMYIILAQTVLSVCVAVPCLRALRRMATPRSGLLT